MRIDAQAVPVDAEFIRPIHQSRERTTFPQANLAGAGRIEIVVIALEAHLTAGVYRDVIAALRPEDVVSQMSIAKVVRDSDRISLGLVDSVVRDIRGCVQMIAVQIDSHTRVGIYQVVSDGVAATG